MSSACVREIQSLLRHLDDARVLRQNALVAHLFERANTVRDERAAVDRVRAAVMTVAKLLQSGRHGRASAIAVRQYEIVMRCDIGGELHRIVARELGLSLRQFYRERHSACERLEELLRRELTAAAAPARPPLDEFAMRVNCAEGLRAVGQLERALDVLRTLAAEATDVSDRIRVWCEIAVVSCEAGRLTQGRQALDSAWRLRYAMDGGAGGDPAKICVAEIEYASAIVAWESGNLVAATSSYERVLATLESLDAGTPERALELSILASIGIATLQRESGNTDAALSALVRARETLARTGEPLPALRARLSVSIASAYAVALGGLSMAESELEFAAQWVRQYNLQQFAVMSAALLSMIAFFRGDLQTALRHGRAALAVGRTVSGVDTLVYCALNTARVEALLGRSSVAMNLVEEARSRLHRESVMWTMTDVTEAEVLLASGAPRRAATLVAGAVAPLQLSGMERYLGAALRIEADALAAGGMEDKAARSIDAAVEILERRGHPYSLAQAYASSAKITGNPAHRAKAVHLYGLLRA